MTREQVDYLAVSHLLIVIRVYHVKQILDLLFSFYNVHVNDQLSEFLFVDDPIAIAVDILE